jgi:hypothetical protein
MKDLGSRLRYDEAETLHLFTYMVEGRGAFPIDMLRRDRSWPATEADATLVQLGSLGPRRVRLLSYQLRKLWNPNEDRWGSFGWTVLKTELWGHEFGIP